MLEYNGACKLVSSKTSSRNVLANCDYMCGVNSVYQYLPNFANTPMLSKAIVREAGITTKLMEAWIRPKRSEAKPLEAYHTTSYFFGELVKF